MRRGRGGKRDPRRGSRGRQLDGPGHLLSNSHYSGHGGVESGSVEALVDSGVVEGLVEVTVVILCVRSNMIFAPIQQNKLKTTHAWHRCAQIQIVR